MSETQDLFGAPAASGKLWERSAPKAKGAASNAANADQRAANVLPVIRQIQASGATTLRAGAAALNARGIRTARGGEWYATSVNNVLAREVAA